jgi:hypothetical protein
LYSARIPKALHKALSLKKRLFLVMAALTVLSKQIIDYVSSRYELEGDPENDAGV